MSQKISVVLPANFSFRVSSLQILNASGTTIPAADGSVRLPLAQPGVPGLVEVLAPDGTVLLLSFVDSTQGNPTIGPKDTATALLFVALAGFRLPPDTQRKLLELIQAHPATQGLADTLSSLMATNPKVLSQGDPILDQALVQAFEALKAVAPPSSPRISPRIFNGGDVANLLITPQTEQSGVRVDNSSSAAGSFQVTNNLRRRTRSYLYKRATYDNQNSRTDLLPAQEQGAEINLSATQNLSSFLGLIQQALFVTTGVSEQTAFVPQVSPPQAVSPDETAAKTLFHLVTVGSSTQWDNEALHYTGRYPNVWDDPAYAGRRDRWLQTSKDMTQDAYFFDVWFPLIDCVLGLSSLNLRQPSVDISGAAGTLVGEIQNAFNLEFTASSPGSTVIPGSVASKITSLILKGSWAELTRIALRLCKNNPRLLGYVVDAVAVGQTDSRLIKGLGEINELINALNLAIGAADIKAVLQDLETSNFADSWEITAIRPKVTLSPGNTTITTGSKQIFRISSPGVEGLGLSLTYHWNLSGNAGGTLSDGGAHSGQRDFDSTSNEVEYQAPASGVKGDVDVLTGTVFVLTPDGPQGQVLKETVGSANATLTLDDEVAQGTAQIIPRKASLVSQQVLPLELLIPENLGVDRSLATFEWNTSGGLCTFAGGETTSRQSGEPASRINLTCTAPSNQSGTQHVSVRILQPGGDGQLRLKATGSADYAVNEVRKTVFFGSAFGESSYRSDGTFYHLSAGAGWVFPAVPNEDQVQSYSVYIYNWTDGGPTQRTMEFSFSPSSLNGLERITVPQSTNSTPGNGEQSFFLPVSGLTDVRSGSAGYRRGWTGFVGEGPLQSGQPSSGPDPTAVFGRVNPSTVEITVTYRP